MSSLADSSPSLKMHLKRSFVNSVCSDNKYQKLNADRRFPAKCGPTAESDIISPHANDIYSSNNVKHSKMDFARDLREKCGLSAYNINKGESEKLVNGKKYVLPIDAVPLRSVPPSDEERDTENSDNYEREKKSEDNVNNVCSYEVTWKHDSDKLAAVTVEAKKYLNAFDVMHSTSRQILDSEDLLEITVHPDINIKTPAKGINEPKNYDDNKKDLINLCIVKHEQPLGLKVKKLLKLFDKYYTKIVKEHKSQLSGERKGAYPHLEVAERLKKEGKYISPEKPFGHIPGVEIGDEFRFRSQLAVVGLHRQLIAGIDHVILGGKKYATSVVDSGRYENTARNQDILIYSGQGGNPKNADNSVDQKLERGNLALMNSMEMGYPIRVTYKRKSLTGHDRGVVYVYDGLYTLINARQERDQAGKLVFKFELHRMFDQPRSHQINDKSEEVETRKEICKMEDISQGKEKIPISVMNDVDDDDSPPSFTYITRMVYPHWYYQIDPDGCDCINGCSDSHQCHCIVQNGGEVPYNEKGSIIRRRPRIHECGPSCKCPPTCMNRVGQLGPRFRLEIFKTEKRGWGVRSRDLIPSGGFICEYLGEFLRDKEADLRVNDEYLFDIYNSRVGRDGFAIDAAMCGNIGRFINHSCSPNLYAQDVLYDHGDKRMPHVMFFATKDIPPLQELCYDYNYKLNTVCDANGNVKTKDCYCGSRKCTKRMY